MPRCLICGKKRGVKSLRLPHGSIHICNDLNCRRRLIYGFEGAVPLIWLDMSSIEERYADGCDTPQTYLAGSTEPLTYSPEELVSLEKHIFEGADVACSQLWDGSGDEFGRLFNDALAEAVVEMERARVEKASWKELLLLIGKVKFPCNKTILEERLKKGGKK